MSDQIGDPSVGLLIGVGVLIVCAIGALTCHLCCDRSDGEAVWFDGSQEIAQMSGIDPEEAAVIGRDPA